MCLFSNLQGGAAAILKAVNPVGRYQIAGEIGRGAMGVVYKALDPAIGRTVAIKTIHLTDVTDAVARQRVREKLLGEAQSAGTLSHPNIVTVYDVLTENDFAYIVMEFVPGPSLDEMLRQHQIPEREELIVYLRQVAQALDYAHRKGVVHRDVKPGNILISATGVGAERLAKITDFGVAKTFAEGAVQSGSMTGTPSYMSPEQIEGGVVDGRSDQFSLAIVVYELLAGRKPFEAESVDLLFQQICRSPARPIEETDPTLSPTVSKVMARALAKRPEDRFASVSDFIGALSIALGETHSGAAASTTREAYAVLGNPPQLVAFSSQAGMTQPRGEIAEEEESPRRTGRKKLALIMLLCFAVAAAVVFIVRLNSGTAVPVQVLDPSTAPTTPSAATPPAATPRPAASTAPPAAAASIPAPAPVKVSPNPPAAAERPAIAPSVPAANAAARSTSKPAAHEPSTAEGRSIADVDLVSEPVGARITVDGRPDATCNAPCTMTLSTGRHTLTAELNGYATARRIFTLPETPRLFIPMAQDAGVFVVTSIPAGSTVIVDGKLYGQTPATLHLSAGVHRILLVNGPKRHEEAVNIDPGSFQTRSIRW